MNKALSVSALCSNAPALAKANVGIAMGVLGSDVSIETADIAPMRDDLSKVPYVIDLSRNTLRVIKQNITASILVKAVFALLAIPGFNIHTLLNLKVPILDVVVAPLRYVDAYAPPGIHACLHTNRLALEGESKKDFEPGNGLALILT